MHADDDGSVQPVPFYAASYQAPPRRGSRARALVILFLSAQLTPNGLRADGAQAQQSRAAVSVSVIYELPLDKNPRWGLESRWQPFGDPWFIKVRLLRYLPRSDQRPWHPDFTYSFGYEDWRPDTWSLYYSNHTPTRLWPDRGAGEHRFNIMQGEWTVLRRFALPADAGDKLRETVAVDAVCKAGLAWVPRYTRSTAATLGHDKQFLLLGCRFDHRSGVYAELTGFHYLHGRHQQRWDPDYAWEFGIAHGSFGLKYSNHTGSRFPWRERVPSEGGWRDGKVSLEWAWRW